jgi:hypothetical protein
MAIKKEILDNLLKDKDPKTMVSSDGLVHGDALQQRAAHPQVILFPSGRPRRRPDRARNGVGVYCRQRAAHPLLASQA